ncbi:hypothetical protein MMC09_005266 [Bachmanniomyces sp. S44760]|nr:hypothetical protein [Bachmanniomyces sp. S44760]
MHLRTLGTLVLGIVTVHAFRDTSPFFFYSTSEFLVTSSQVATASTVLSSIKDRLASCLSDTYVIVSQPGVNAVDYSNRSSAPHLRKALSGDNPAIRSSYSVPDVLGEVDPSALMETIEGKCGAGVLNVDASTGSFDIIDDMKPRVIRLDFPALPTGPRRVNQLSENDAFIASLIDLLPSTKYTVLYTTTPLSTEHQASLPDSATYQMDQTPFSVPHAELKRDVFQGRQNGDNFTLVDGPLFEKYQFFTPGIFMGLIVGILLLSILYVGISGVSSLQVSYAAFDRENGPAAQKGKAQ